MTIIDYIIFIAIMLLFWKIIYWWLYDEITEYLRDKINEKLHKMFIAHKNLLDNQKNLDDNYAVMEENYDQLERLYDQLKK